MSLLMDALKKAELAKRQGKDAPPISAAEGDTSSGNIALEPMTSTPADRPGTEAPPPFAATANNTLPDLPLDLEQLDAEFLADAQQQRSRPAGTTVPSATAPRPSPAHGKSKDARQEPRHQADRAAVRNVFSSKEPPRSNPRFGLILGGLTLLAIAGIGGYFWWQLQPKSGLTDRQPTPQTTPSMAPYVAATAPAAAQLPGQESRVPTRPSADASAALDRHETDEMNPQSEIHDSATEDVHHAPPAQRGKKQVEETDEPVRLTRSPLRIDPALSRGFDALMRGDLVGARSDYEKALKTDPKNSDALHGLATIALRQGRTEQAARLYQQLVEINPQDAVAQAALANLVGQTDPGATESLLKGLSANRPELAAPQFALGNLYARQGRWSEAQAAYFQAWNVEPENPDILYNLAISLEHLRQNRLAAEYYNRALHLSETHPANFDKRQAESRLRVLQP